MEYYERIQELLYTIVDNEGKTDEFKELEKFVKEESGKEMYLMFSEFLSDRIDMEFDGFMRLLPLFSLLFVRLSKANKYVTNEYIEHLYNVVLNYKEEKIQEIYNYLINSEEFKTPTQPFILFLVLTASDVTEEIAKMVKKPEDSFVELPTAIKIAISRAAVHNTAEMKGYSLETMADLLLDQRRVKYQESGVALCSKIPSVSSPVKLFNKMISVGPFLSSLEAASSCWRIARDILKKMGDEDKFNALRVGLCNSTIADTARIALITELQRNISKSRSGIFRSPLIGSIINIVMTEDLVTNPSGKIENFLTAMNFLLFLITIDRKERCFLVMGTDKLEFVKKSIAKSKKALSNTKKENKKPIKEILENMKKTNFGENMTEEDIKNGIETSNISIKRAEFAISSLEEILN